MDFSTLTPDLIAALLSDRDGQYSLFESDDYDDIFDDLTSSSSSASSSSSEASINFILNPKPKTQPFTPINPLKYLDIPSHQIFTLYASPRLPAYIARIFSTKPTNHTFRKLILADSRTSPVCDSHIRAIINRDQKDREGIEVFIIPGETTPAGQNITTNMTIELSKSFTNLRVLVLDGIPTFNDEAFSILANNCKEIEYIRICGCELFDGKITDKSLQLLHTPNLLPKLKELVLFDHRKISDLAAYKLCKRREKLAVTTGFTVEGGKITETWCEGRTVMVSVDGEETYVDEDIEEFAGKIGIDTSVEGWEEEYYKDEDEEVEDEEDNGFTEMVEKELRDLIFAPFS